MFDKAKDFIRACVKCSLYMAAFFYIGDQFHSLKNDVADQRYRIYKNETLIESLEKRALELEKGLMKIKRQVKSFN